MRIVRLVALMVAVATIGTLAQPTPAGAATTTARRMFASLTVANEGGSTTYQRAYFRHWIDYDGDCQNTRAEVLIAESRVPVRFTSASRCTVATGNWVSPWDQKVTTLASDLDADHTVALKEAWESGARGWSAINRQRFANDTWSYTINGLTDNVNSSKGDRDIAQWLPPATSTRCAYARQVVAIKYRWKLTINTAERNVLAYIFAGSCGNIAMTVPPRAM